MLLRHSQTITDIRVRLSDGTDINTSTGRSVDDGLTGVRWREHSVSCEDCDCNCDCGSALRVSVVMFCERYWLRLVPGGSTNRHEPPGITKYDAPLVTHFCAFCFLLFRPALCPRGSGARHSFVLNVINGVRCSVQYGDGALGLPTAET